MKKLQNVTQANQRRIDISVDIEYGTSNEKIDIACNILKNIALDHPDIKDGAISFIENMAPSSIVIRLVAYRHHKNLGGMLLWSKARF